MPVPVALLAGAGLAGLAGLSNYFEGKSDAERAADTYDKIMGMAGEATAANQADIDKYGGLVNKTYGQGAAMYDQALADFLNSPVYQNEGFGYDGDIGQFYDPAANQRVAAAMDAINASASAAGNRFSSDYVNRVAAKQQALASEEWQKAYDRLMADRQRALGEWQANSQNNWNNYGATQDRARYAVDAYGNDRNAYMQGQGDVLSAGIMNRNANLQTMADAMGGKTEAENSAPGLFSSILNPIAGFTGKFFGGA